MLRMILSAILLMLGVLSSGFCAPKINFTTNPNGRIVLNATYVPNSKNKKVLFSLSDGMYVTYCAHFGERYKTFGLECLIGKQVLFTTQQNNPSIHMILLDDSNRAQNFRICISKDTMDYMLIISDIAVETSALSSRANILLNDESSWITEAPDDCRLIQSHWKKGDRILITKGHKYTYLFNRYYISYDGLSLINLDAPAAIEEWTWSPYKPDPRQVKATLVTPIQ